MISFREFLMLGALVCASVAIPVLVIVAERDLPPPSRTRPACGNGSPAVAGTCATMPVSGAVPPSDLAPQAKIADRRDSVPSGSSRPWTDPDSAGAAPEVASAEPAQPPVDEPAQTGTLEEGRPAGTDAGSNLAELPAHSEMAYLGEPLPETQPEGPAAVPAPMLPPQRPAPVAELPPGAPDPDRTVPASEPKQVDEAVAPPVSPTRPAPVREASLPAPKSDVVGAPSLPDTVAPAGVPQTETPFVMLPPPRPVPAPDGPPRTLAPPAEAQFESAEEGSRAFAYSYLQSWSSSNDKALSDLRGLFGSRVSYYGRSLDQNSLFEKKRRFAERWPVRNYRHRPGTLSVRCEKPAGQCWVRSIVDWDAANPTRNAKKRGAFRFELGIDVSGPRPIVRSENMPQLANLAPKPAPAEARGAARPRPEPSVKGQPLQLPGALLPDDTISDEGDDETTLLEN